MLSSPCGALAFHELRRYNTRPLRLDWGPENVHFGKTHFWYLNFDARVLTNDEKLKEKPGATFLSFAFFTTVPKNGP